MPRELYNNPNQRQSGSRNYGSQQGGSQASPAFMEEIRKVRNLSELSVDEIAKEDGIAEQAAKEFKINTTQLRKFFDQAKSIEANLKERGWEDVSGDFAMLRPILAYAKGRKLIPELFYQFMTTCMGKVVSEDEQMTRKNYQRFIQILEALVAYRKYYGEK